jgi:hypothetical protein
MKFSRRLRVKASCRFHMTGTMPGALQIKRGFRY